MGIYRRVIVIVVLLLMACGGVYLYRSQVVDENYTGQQEDFYSHRYPDQQGKAFDFAGLQGRVTVVNFWATWCAPCRKEIPDLSAISQDYAQRRVAVIGIAADDLPAIQEFLQAIPASYTFVAAEFDAMAISRDLGNTKGILPFTVLMDGDGNIITRISGLVHPMELRAMLDKAVAGQISN
ncbi:TlpA disulfide reductase family protein [Methylobacillus sp.]|uniref:TlpA disulfide reductase family protein n=1 Tax=Methylobacillus sp. TaxID=56818 RepID=UPI002FE1F62A